MFSNFEAGSERKDAFFSYFRPIVDEVNQQVLADREVAMKACANNQTSGTHLQKLSEKYRINEADLKTDKLCDLFDRRINYIPASLALAQAANESAWGTSRFAQSGNNFFGQWCFEKGCGLVPKSRDKNKAHEVATFRSPYDSVESYILNLNGHDAYKPLRLIRESVINSGVKLSGIQLTRGLDKYSERGEEYGEELRSMIRFNDLTRFD